MNNIEAPPSLSDEQLVNLSLSGNTDAFAHLINRYKNLVCSVTYNFSGSIHSSEDLAQEVFITAWKELRKLQNPARFKSWVCGITRNISNNFLRKQQSLSPQTTPVETDLESPSSHDPVRELISQEEERLLWDALKEIPIDYREPMVLFYRENASVREVATALDLSEDAVRQRLSRGRAMLRTQVTAWVEKSLRKTGPGKAFTLGVLVLLPAAGTEVGAATLAAAGTTSTSAKASSLLGASGAVAGPLAGVLGGVIGARASYRAAQSDAERKFVLKFTWLISGGVLLFGAVFFSVLFYGKQIAGQHPILFASIIAAVVIAYMTALVVAIYKANERQRQIQIEQGTYNPAHDLPLQALPGRSLLLNLAAGVGGSLSWVLIATFQLRHWYFFSLTLLIGIATVAIALKLSLLNRSKSQRYAIFACAAMGVWTLALLDTLPEVLLAHIEKTGEWKNLIIIGVNLFIILLHVAILGSIWLRNRRAAFFYERRNQQS